MDSKRGRRGLLRWISDNQDKLEYPSSEPATDPNYRGPAGDFGKNVSPDGAIEYTGNAFSALKGKLLVTRYSGFDDVVAVTLGSDGNATSIDSIVPTRSFTDPLDIAQSPTTGYLYVSWYDEKGDQTLLLKLVSPSCVLSNLSR